MPIKKEEEEQELENKLFNQFLDNRILAKNKPKRWSRKGSCPSCDVRTGSRHKKTCTVNYKML